MTYKQPPSILRNLDNFPPGEFYSTSTPPTSTIRHKRVHKQDNILNKRTEIISKYRHSNKYKLANYGNKDQY